MGHKVPWKTGMLIFDPVAVLSPCDFATIGLTSLHSEVLYPLSFATHEMGGPFRNAPDMERHYS